ncbi:hypothetical protein [Sphaerisporangium album]|uniref:hypothetical protein n=1 Tax=Sphaerisporangium album TaxID=509200 RepID=UPI0011C019AF|nr:hypothetical protein [Sphaerisporangium album]
MSNDSEESHRPSAAVAHAAQNVTFIARAVAMAADQARALKAAEWATATELAMLRRKASGRAVW